MAAIDVQRSLELACGGLVVNTDLHALYLLTPLHGLDPDWAHFQAIYAGWGDDDPVRHVGQAVRPSESSYMDRLIQSVSRGASDGRKQGTPLRFVAGFDPCCLFPAVLSPDVCSVESYVMLCHAVSFHVASLPMVAAIIVEDSFGHFPCWDHLGRRAKRLTKRRVMLGGWTKPVPACTRAFLDRT